MGSAPLQWHRGPARLDDGFVVLDLERAQTYQAFGEELANLPWDLANVRRPTDALGFVRRYGLLWTGPLPPYVHPMHLVEGASAESQDWSRERFSDWEEATIALRNTLALYSRLVRAQRGDHLALRDLRAWATESVQALARLRAADVAMGGDEPSERLSVESDAGFLDGVAQLIAHSVNIGVRGDDEEEQTGFSVGATASGDSGPAMFGFMLAPRTLVGVAWVELAAAIVGQLPMATCPECGRVFLVKHGRQRFCDVRCAGRARYRRHADKKRRTEGDNA